MMMNTGQVLSMLKNNGFIKTSDQLGIYFDKGNRKFSCMKHGFNYICYHNISIDKNWTLVNKSGILKDYNEALKWVIEEARRWN